MAFIIFRLPHLCKFHYSPVWFNNLQLIKNTHPLRLTKKPSLLTTSLNHQTRSYLFNQSFSQHPFTTRRSSPRYLSNQQIHGVFCLQIKLTLGEAHRKCSTCQHLHPNPQSIVQGKKERIDLLRQFTDRFTTNSNKKPQPIVPWNFTANKISRNYHANMDVFFLSRAKLLVGFNLWVVSVLCNYFIQIEWTEAGGQRQTDKTTATTI